MTEEGTGLPPRRPPMLFGGCVLLFWGIYTGHYIIGGILALLMEGHRLTGSRWELSDVLLGRIWQFCFIVFFVILGIGIFKVGLFGVMFLCLEWLPVVLFPMAFAQVYGTRDRLPTAAFSMLARYMKRTDGVVGGRPRVGGAVNIEYIYLFFVLLSASGANRAGPVFYVVAVVFAAWALWQNADRLKAGVVLWLACFVFVAFGGYVSQIWLHRLHIYIENSTFFMDLAEADPDMSVASTRIGRVGELKESPRIVWRVRGESGAVPAYLRSGTYNLYRGEVWFSRDFRDFRDVGRARDSAGVRHWRLAEVPAVGACSRLVVVGKGGEQTFLALPGTPCVLDGLGAGQVKRNVLGMVKVMDAPRILRIGVDYVPVLSGDMPPAEDDLFVPDEERPVLARVIDSLDLDDVEPDAVLDSLSRFFSDKFRYTTYLTSKASNMGVYASALEDFLERTHAGHCEYFGTATVLLLRQAGIPARYVVGYSLAEYNRRSREYIVRNLHGHAWAQAWIDGRWQYVDNTPAGWVDVEGRALSFMQPVSDWFNGLPYVIGLWLASPAGRKVVSVLKLGSLPVLAFYLWFRLFRNQRSRRVRKKKVGAVPVEVIVQGVDSDAYVLERCLAESVEVRSVGMPLRVWWRMIAGRFPVEIASAAGEAIDLHYRYRFDPAGMAAGEQARLRELVAGCLERLDVRRR